MSKKGIVLVLLISSLLTLIVMGVFGKLPEQTVRVPVQEIEIYNENNEKITNYNDDGDLVFSTDCSTSEISYKFYIVVLPKDATDPSLFVEVVSFSGDEGNKPEAPIDRSKEIDAKAGSNPEYDANGELITHNKFFYEIKFKAEQDASIPKHQLKTVVRFSTNKRDSEKIVDCVFTFAPKKEDTVEI